MAYDVNEKGYVKKKMKKFQPKNIFVYLFFAYLIFIVLNGNFQKYLDILLGRSKK